MVPVSDPLTLPTRATLHVEGLRIRRGFTDLITGFTWQHEAGSPAWLIGENGAGKSSLLRVLAGRARPAAGVVRRRGVARGLAPLYYHPATRLPSTATVADWERLTEPLLVGAPPLEEPLSPALPPDRRLDRLSTGEEKRLLLAVLLRRASSFLFLDEPYEHLSEEARTALTDILSRRSRHDVVVVATNQPIPGGVGGAVIRLDGCRACVTRRAEATA